MTVLILTMKTVYKILRGPGVAFALAMVAILASAYPGVLTAQAGDTSMTGMKKAGAPSRRPDMRDMMRAPLPFGIMIGRAEQWMVGYQYMFEKLDGILDGTNAISEANVLTRFPTTPTDMTMHAHMGMIMYAPTASSTLMAMLPYVEMSMGELHRDGTRSTERSKGIGDLELRGLYSLRAAKELRHRILANFGVGLPTGSVNQRDAKKCERNIRCKAGREHTRCCQASPISASQCHGAGEQSLAQRCGLAGTSTDTGWGTGTNRESGWCDSWQVP